MKTLTIVRHAKSEWGNDNLEDIYRPLNETGYTDSRILSKQLFKKIATPDCWLTSPAVRAYSTAIIFANSFIFRFFISILHLFLYKSASCNAIFALWLT